MESCVGVDRVLGGNWNANWQLDEAFALKLVGGCKLIAAELGPAYTRIQ